MYTVIHMYMLLTKAYKRNHKLTGGQTEDRNTIKILFFLLLEYKAKAKEKLGGNNLNNHSVVSMIHVPLDHLL